MDSTRFVVLVLLCASRGTSFQINKTGCYKTKGCISFPTSCSSSEDCDYLLTYIPNKDTVTFEMSTRNEYVGFGLNEDPVMAGTDAIICSKTPTNVSATTIGHYTLPNHATPHISKPTPSGLTEMSSVYENGIIKCRYRRNKVPTPPMKYNLNDKHYFIYARGKTSESGGLIFHVWKDTSAKKESLTFTGPIKEANDVLIAVHAGLMLLAWVGFASIGMFTARNMKTLWGQTFCNVKIWFQVHRACMTIAVVLTMSGVAVIFVFVGGWSQIAGWHAIIGVAVVSLATLQPFIAVFRPSTESKHRFLFVWTHRGIAVVVFVLAMTNCFLGMRLVADHVTFTHRGFQILLVFVITYTLCLLLCEVCSCCVDHEWNDSLLAFDRNDISVDEVSQSMQLKGRRGSVNKMVYGFVALLCIAVCSSFITIIIISWYM